MSCPQDRLQAWFDEELDAMESASVERHVESCAACSETAARLRAQRDAIRGGAPYYRAPADLRDSIRHSLRAAEAPSHELPWRWLALAASVLLALSVAWNILMLRPRTAEARLAESVLDDHIRALMTGHVADVPSSDRHTVKPWFAGKLDFSPDVKDLAGEGFPLTGGRVEYLAGRRVAALVYQRRQHVIDLFTWPAEATPGATRISRNGYHLVHWNAGGMTYWAVSDASADELEQFKSLYAQ